MAYPEISRADSKPHSSAAGTGTNTEADGAIGHALDAYDFELPRDRIAQRPAHPRDEARLLDITSGGAAFNDRLVRDLPELLPPRDIVVVNDTKVIPARLFARSGSALVEITLVKAETDATWRAFARPARRLSVGDTIEIAAGFTATVAAKGERGEVTLTFDRSGVTLQAALNEFGAMPLPPYIKRPAGGEGRDRDDYQTLFAAKPGAVAAPTAGLHFTPGLVARLDAQGIQRCTVTLHVGAGTFLPLTPEILARGTLHSEWGEITATTAAAIAAAKNRGGRVVAVGTTTLRLLEAAGRDGRIAPFAGPIDLFIRPGFRFQIVDLLLTNFHLPRSSLFMLVSAFAGTARMQAAYAHAIATGYRFYSYGDASLLDRAQP